MKAYPLLMFGCLLLSITAQAQMQNPKIVQQILTHAEKGEPVPLEVLEQADIQQNDVQAQIDIMLQQLLSIPFEQRQYIFPALFDTPSVPKKIRTHPEIAIWEGKVPTRIAPQAQAFAAQYLQDMNPKMYIYLAPEAFKNSNRDTPTETLSSNLAIAVKQAKPIKTTNHEKIEYKRIQEIFKQPDSLRQNPTKQTLTEEKIKKLRSGLNAFNSFLNNALKHDPAFRSGYRNLTLFHTAADAEKINPFQAKVERLQLLKKLPELDTLLKQAGWDSVTDFAVAADTMIRSYRAANMPLRFAFEANRYRGQTPKDKAEWMSVTLAKMYEALPADVYMVMKHMPQIRQDFIDTGYQSVLNAETLDEYRK